MELNEIKITFTSNVEEESCILLALRYNTIGQGVLCDVENVEGKFQHGIEIFMWGQLSEALLMDSTTNNRSIFTKF
jgi:hypothetical protein